MKQLFTILFTLTVVYGSAQSIERNEVDEFTNDQVIETSYTGLARNAMHPLQAFVSFKKINEQYYLSLKAVVEMGAVFSLDKGSEFMIKLDNGEIITLQTPEYVTSCRGCASNGLAFQDQHGVRVDFALTGPLLAQLKFHNIQKIRLYTNDGYAEAPVTKGSSKKLQKGIDLIAG